MALENSPSPTEMPIVQFRIERGDTVVGTDGVLGQVEQIVVERENRQLRSLIMRGTDSENKVELPANHIVRTLEHQVELNIGRNDLQAHPDLAAPYDPNQFVPIFEGPQKAENVAGEVSAESGEPVVTEVEPNAAELISARPEIAPEGEMETMTVNPPVGETEPDIVIRPSDLRQPQAAEAARGEDRVVESPSVVPAAEVPPEARGAFTLPEDKDLMGAEAPPTPTGRQLPPSGKTSPSEVSAEQMEEEEFELVEQFEPFFLPENMTFREVRLPWRTLAAITGLAVASVTAGYLIWRWRHETANPVGNEVARKATKLGMKVSRWQPRRAARATVRETRHQLRDTLESARASAEDVRENVRHMARASQRTLKDTAKTPPERLRWFQRGARTGRALNTTQMLGTRLRATASEWMARPRMADVGEDASAPRIAETRPMAPTRTWIILRPSRVPDTTQTPS